ncbi:hypothetical protein OHA10_17990 [Kribbella sp. NBC_00662]|uniref:hypothetical protein n=1 Tax=Kribbella sp. NBC_00662 TaxID=2975969 RepID=UPI003245697A
MTITLTNTLPRIRAELVVLDERFARIAGDEYVECLYDGGRWLEGPASRPATSTAPSTAPVGSGEIAILPVGRFGRHASRIGSAESVCSRVREES